MFAETLNTQLLAALDRPDLRVVAGHRRIVFDAALDTAFCARPNGEVVLGAACLGPERICAFHIRHALELSTLLDVVAGLPDRASAAAYTGPIAQADLPILAGLFAARVAARFWLLDEAPADAPPVADPAAWLQSMGAALPPDRSMLAFVWGRVRALQGPSYGRPCKTMAEADDNRVPDTVAAELEACWSLLGPAETLMAEGGDGRLAVDRHTGLNRYGCSHRPRPWAITFASSTASSLSERGFGGAEAARKRLIAGALCGEAQQALTAENECVRQAIARHYGLDDRTGIVLTASGTDAELIALAMAALPTAGQPARPVSNILVAPDETGAGVPLAADGRHFAAEAAQGAAVAKGQRVAGFPDGTRVLEVAIRDGDGRLLQAGAVDAACLALAEAEAAQGRVVLMHRVDLSKTGLLAPGLDALEDLQARLGDRLQVAVDACQARLDRRRVQADLARDWMVMITGSKFFTGPPFCGALLLPRLLTRRLAEASPGALPAGLGDYGGRTDWPAAARAADALPMRPNAGLLLRWQAALAEMQAFSEVTDADASRWTAAFVAGVQSVLDASPDLLPVMVPAPFRRDLTIIDGAGKPLPCWDQIQTIRSFLVLAAGSGARPPLDMEQARRIYRWLNADVTRALPEHASVEDRAHARLLCHIGQPAPVAHDALDGRMAGALRISVGARLLSGEPSHAGLGTSARLAREIADVGRIAAKISLLLRHWDALVRLDPEPRFASDAPLRRRADPGLNI